jgi:glutamate racemase
MSADAAIGVFDSGVGGLSVLREIRALLPAENLIYVADSAHAPYGDRPADFIQQRAAAVVGFFAGAGAKAIVVACNTATAVAIQGLRSRFQLPVVAIEPAVKPAAAMTQSGVIGILATRQTLESERFLRLVEDHGKGLKVLTQPCPGFVEQVEKGELEGAATDALVGRYVRPLVDGGADVIVLGCTHYPYLHAVISRVAGPGVSIVDPAVAVARQLERRLEAANLLASLERAGTEQFWTSGAPETVRPVVAKLWARDVEVKSLAALVAGDS